MTLPQMIARALDADPEELKLRLNQQVFARMNRTPLISSTLGLSSDAHLLALSVSDSTLVDWWRQRHSRWFLNAEKREFLSERYQDRDLELALIQRRADQVCEGKMPLFSHEPVEFSGSDRWRRDHILGVSAPESFSDDLDYLKVAVVGDSKNVWEPNRFGWVYWLGAAFVLTGERKYAQKFAELSSDWFAQNPYPFGVNYCSALEVGLRCYAWVWALSFFENYLHEKPKLLSQLLGGVWIGCQHVENNLSTYFAPNTHITGEAFALFACGAALPDFPESYRWRRLGSEILSAESAKQFHNDGTHRELSTCYHLYSTDFYLQATLISRQTGFTISDTISETARQLSRRLSELAPADLTLPQINDCDGGRLTWFCFHPLDAAPALRSAESMFSERFIFSDERDGSGYDLWMAASSPETTGSSATSAPPAPSAPERDYSRCDSGLLSYQNTAGDFLLFRSGPFGYLDCGHSHDGPTGLTLYLGGCPLILDSGTGAYTQSMEIRNRFRAGAGQNILLINGRGPSEPDQWFTWKRQTECHLSGVQNFAGGFYCKGRYKGYRAVCGFEVDVAREIILLDEGLVLLIDSWGAENEVEATLHLTLNPELKVDTGERRIYQPDGPEFHYLIQPLVTVVDEEQTDNRPDDQENDQEDEKADTEDVDVDDSSEGEENENADAPQKRPKLRVEPAAYSPDYGVMGEGQALQMSFAPSFRGSVVTILSRIGAIRHTGKAGFYQIGEDENERELHVEPSGVIHLRGVSHQNRSAEPVEFAR